MVHPTSTFAESSLYGADKISAFINGQLYASSGLYTNYLRPDDTSSNPLSGSENQIVTSPFQVAYLTYGLGVDLASSLSTGGGGGTYGFGSGQGSGSSGWTNFITGYSIMGGSGFCFSSSSFSSSGGGVQPYSSVGGLQSSFITSIVIGSIANMSSESPQYTIISNLTVIIQSSTLVIQVAKFENVMQLSSQSKKYVLSDFIGSKSDSANVLNLIVKQGKHSGMSGIPVHYAPSIVMEPEVELPISLQLSPTIKGLSGGMNEQIISQRGSDVYPRLCSPQ